MDPYEFSVSEELQAAERRLRAERAVLGPIELDSLKHNIYARAARATARPRSPIMKSRMTITMMLVVGMLMSMSGAGLALTGSSGTGSAASVQYQPETTNTQQVNGAANAAEPRNEPRNEVKAAQQVAAAEPAQESDSLPFTGYAVLAILFGGLGLLGFGLFLRYQTRGSDLV